MSPRTADQYEVIRKEKQELIRQTALKLFASKGFHATTISTIANAAGISKGLMYNYYESKEELLVDLFADYISLVGALLNPNSDQEISNQEMEQFFELQVKSFKEQPDYWLLFFQLSMQPQVLELIMSKLQNTAFLVGYRSLLFSYFADRFERPEEEFMVFNSFIKGFSLIYVLSPESFTDEMLKAINSRFKAMFIREKLTRGTNGNIVLSTAENGGS